MTPSHERTVCLLSPHPLVLEDLAQILSDSGLSIRTCRVEPMPVGKPRKPAVPTAELYVIDAHFPRPATETLVSGILRRFPDARLLVLGDGFTDASAFPLLQLGVKGLIPYGKARDSLAQALLAVATGGFWVPRSLLSRFMDSISTSLRNRRTAGVVLSDRESEVLEGLARSLANKEIAKRLHISERTVKFHVSNLLAKFGVERRQELILQCMPRARFSSRE